jgi:hypothetical protein
MSDNVLTEYVGKNKLSEINNKWWLSKDDASRNLFAVVRYIEQNQEYRSKDNLLYARLYSNTELLGLSTSTYSRSNSSLPQNRLTLNVIKSCIDTASAKISQNKPRPRFLTEKGSFSLKRKSELLTQYLDGLFDDLQIYKSGQKAFIDSCVFGTGAVKIYVDPSDQKVKAERVLIDEIIVDDVEGMYGTPRQMFQKKVYSTEILVDAFPKFKDKILSASSLNPDEAGTRTIADQVEVIEAWHLPSGPKSNDGKHVIAIDNCILFEEAYEDTDFPFVFLRWSDKLAGFFGSGLAFELIGLQREINKTLKTIQQSLELMAVPRVFVDVASNINTASITDQIGSIIKYQGNPPVFQTSQAVSPELISHLESLYRKSYEITGISMMQAQSKKPEGLNSGVALREMSDIASERFLTTGQRYEQFFMDIAKKLINASKKLYQKGIDNSVKSVSNKFIKTIKWSEIDLDEDKFSMRAFPVSLLPTTPAGKLQTVQELIQAGLIPQEQALSLLNFPDVEQFLSLQTAAQDNIERYLELMVDEGQYNPPEPFMNLNLALTLTQNTYLRCKTENLPEEKLELLRTFMDQIQTLLQIQEEQAAPPPEAQPTDLNLPIPPTQPVI